MSWFVKQRRAQSVDDFETWIEGGVSPTLNAFDNTGDSRATVIIFDNSYRDGLRIQKGNTVNTLSAKMGTGGNNVPFVAREVIAIPIQDGREIEKKQNGLGIGQEGDPSYTLDQTGAQSVAYIKIENDMTTDINGSEIAATLRGFGHGWQGQQNSTHSVAVTEEQEETIMQVRRLTPIECERLMGWADNHTLPRADGKQNADTTRYKMCGNGVASPVAAWIGTRLMEIQNAPRDL